MLGKILVSLGILGLGCLDPSVAMARPKADLCLKAVDVRIKNLYPPIRLQEDFQREAEIRIRVPIDCQTGSVRRPSSFGEALTWLDVALPIDFKSAIASGDYANAYKYSRYGQSVEDDLFFYLEGAWKLDSRNICDKNDLNKTRAACFFYLLDQLRNGYKNPPLIN
jgi:hypothetical protein